MRFTVSNPSRNSSAMPATWRPSLPSRCRISRSSTRSVWCRVTRATNRRHLHPEMREGPRGPRAFGLEQWRMSELPSLDVGWGTRPPSIAPSGRPVPRPNVPTWNDQGRASFGGTFGLGGALLTIVDVRDRRLRRRRRGHRAGRVDPRISPPSGDAAGRGAGRAVPLARRPARHRRAPGVGDGRGIRGRAARRGRLVRLRRAGRVARGGLPADRAVPDRGGPRGRHRPALARFARRVLLHRVREHRRPAPCEPVHPDADRLPRRRRVEPGGSRLVLDPGRLRTVVHRVRVARREGGRLGAGAGGGLPVDGALRQSRHGGRDRDDGCGAPSRRARPSRSRRSA